MIKIFAITPQLNTGGAISRAEALLKLNGENFEVKLQSEFSPDNLLWCDILFVHLATNDAVLGAIKVAKKLGKKIWVDFCDQFFDIPSYHDCYLFYLDPKNRGILEDAYKLANIVSISNPELAQYVRPLNSNIEYYPCAYDESFYKEMNKPTFKKLISWRGSKGTQGKALHHYAETLATIANEHPDWEWLFIGENPWMIYDGFNKGIKKYVPSDFLGPIQMINAMKNFQPSIHLSLHIDDDFSRCRSNMGYLDATICGAVTIARDWPHWKCPGISNYNDKDGLYDLLTLKIKQTENRSPILKMDLAQAKAHILKNYTFSSVNKLQIPMINKLMEGGYENTSH